jgi:hypothetical protein
MRRGVKRFRDSAAQAASRVRQRKGKESLVDVTGFEPAAPCLQILGAYKMNNLRGVATDRQIRPQVTTLKGVKIGWSILGSY